MLEKYVEYLDELKTRLDQYFTEQKPFLACKAGCGICCKASYYPCSELEYDYVRQGFEQLGEETQEKIRQNAINVIKERKEFLKKNPDIMAFSYTCPFLINNSCGIYEHRPMLCRSHGLIYIDTENANKQNAPYCMRQGLNYANIWDEQNSKFCEEKIKELNVPNRPKAYNLSYSSLMNLADGIEFGDVRMLVEFVIMDIPDYEELLKTI